MKFIEKISNKILDRISIPEDSPLNTGPFSSADDLFLSLEVRKADEQKIKKKYPFRFFCSKTVPRTSRKVRDSIKKAEWAVRYRTTSRYDIIRMPTVSKSYHDKDYLMLHGVFSLLVDFVEVECAHMNYDIPNKPNRSRRLGLDHLDWQINLPGNPNKEYARMTKELYLWWTDCYLNREDSYEIAKRKHPNDQKAASLMSAGIDHFYLQEEQVMLSKVIEIRNSLWT